MCFSAAIVIERLTDSNRTRINAAHVIVEIIAGSFPPAYGDFTWDIHVRYNNSKYLRRILKIIGSLT